MYLKNQMHNDARPATVYYYKSVLVIQNWLYYQFVSKIKYLYLKIIISMDFYGSYRISLLRWKYKKMLLYSLSPIAECRLYITHLLGGYIMHTNFADFPFHNFAVAVALEFDSRQRTL